MHFLVLNKHLVVSVFNLLNNTNFHSKSPPLFSPTCCKIGFLFIVIGQGSIEIGLTFVFIELSCGEFVPLQGSKLNNHVVCASLHTHMRTHPSHTHTHTCLALCKPIMVGSINPSFV